MEKFEKCVNFWYNPFLIIFISLWGKDVLEFGLSSSNMCALVSEIGISTEVWYEIILLEALVSGWGPGQKWFSLLLLVLFGLNEPVILRKIPGSVNSLFLVQMGEGILNIAIKTKVWHSITLFEIFAGL